MPESHKAEKKRIQKANRAAGIGDETGRIVRVKEPPKLSKCTVCGLELRITKTNSEIHAHASSKHNDTVDNCFPGAAAASSAIAAGPSQKLGGPKAAGGKNKGQPDDLSALLEAGLNVSKGKPKR